MAGKRKQKRAEREDLSKPSRWRLQHGGFGDPVREADPETGTPVAVRRAIDTLGLMLANGTITPAMHDAGAIKAAAAAGVRNHVTSIDVRNAHATAATEVVVKDGATVVWRQLLPSAMAAPVAIAFPTPLRGTAATAVNFACLTAGAQVYVNAQGYSAP